MRLGFRIPTALLEWRARANRCARSDVWLLHIGELVGVVEAMTREEYWNQKIAFDCPLKGIRHSIDWCFKNCEMWGREYRDTGDGRTAAFLFCHASNGERMLHDGSITRDN